MDTIMSLESVRETLVKRKHNLSAVGREVGLSFSQMQYLMRGKNPPYRNVKLISDFLRGDDGHYGT